MSELPERTALYRLYDADDVLLYVGIAKDPKARWRSHSRTARATWWPSVSRKAVEWFDTREAADRAETEAINTEKPLHNRRKREGSFTLTFFELSAEIDWSESAPGPASEQIVRILRKEIVDGVYPSGAPLPSGQDFQERFIAAPKTVRKALRLLVAEGLVYQERPRGRYFRT